LENTIMRWQTTALLAAAVAIAGTAPAEAKRKDPRKARTHVAVERIYENPDSYDCIRARGLDPAGNYRGYPCWARAALSGRQNR
jgi:hypothetical protein